ncbi:MAG: hypothetical protein LBR30_03885 [Clostridioides sp.]|jgi:hypothetical protein|nr:hypothetical protein [Clostridioides sp.]
MNEFEKNNNFETAEEKKDLNLGEVNEGETSNLNLGEVNEEERSNLNQDEANEGERNNLNQDEVNEEEKNGSNENEIYHKEDSESVKLKDDEFYYYLGKAKKWTIISLVFEGLGFLSKLSTISIVFFPNPDMYSYLNDPALNNDPGLQVKMMEATSGPMAKIELILSLIVAVYLIISYVKSNKKLKEGEVPSKLPYYVSIGFMFVSIILNILTNGGSAGITSAGVLPEMFVNIIMGISYFITLLYLLPVVMSIKYLFKLEK